LYAGLARTHLVPPPFGATRLDRLRPSDVEALLLAKRRAGRAASTVRSVHQVLRVALDAAVRDGLLARNPAAAVSRPVDQRREAVFLSPAEAGTLLRALDGDRLRPLFLLLLGTGLRRGEALALRWPDVDLDGATVRVRGTLSRVGGALVVTEPKTAARRSVPLPGRVVEELRAHRRAQVEERLAAGTLWRDTGHVFATCWGTPVEPRNALRSLQRAAERAGLPGVGVHTLRHKAASTLLTAGAGMKTVQELLGHASFAITADVYGHVAPETRREAADRLAAALGW